MIRKQSYNEQFSPVRHDYPPIVNACVDGCFYEFDGDQLRVCRSDLKKRNVRAWRDTLNIINKITG